MKRRAAAVLVALAAVGLLSGCTAKQIDVAVTGATQVPGSGNLWRFCDGSTLIYFTNSNGGQDDYEFIVYGGCSENPPSQDGVQNLPDDDK